MQSGFCPHHSTEIVCAHVTNDLELQNPKNCSVLTTAVLAGHQSPLTTHSVLKPSSLGVLYDQ